MTENVIERLRARIGQEFDGECHLTAAEARLLFDVYETACPWRADRGQIEGTLLWRDREAADRLVAAVDVADGGELPRARVVE